MCLGHRDLVPHTQHAERVQFSLPAFGEGVIAVVSVACAHRAVLLCRAARPAGHGWPQSEQLNSIPVRRERLLYLLYMINESSYHVVCRLTWWLLFLSMYTTRLPVLAYLLIRVVIGQDPWPNTAVWTLVYVTTACLV